MRRVSPVKLLCGLEASQGAVEEVVSSAASVKADAWDSSEDQDQDQEHEEDCELDSRLGRKKKNKRRKGILTLLEEYAHGFLKPTCLRSRLS